MSAIYFSVLYLNTMHRVDGLHIEGPELNTLNLVIMIFSRNIVKELFDLQFD